MYRFPLYYYITRTIQITNSKFITRIIAAGCRKRIWTLAEIKWREHSFCVLRARDRYWESVLSKRSSCIDSYLSSHSNVCIMFLVQRGKLLPSKLSFCCHILARKLREFDCRDQVRLPAVREEKIKCHYYSIFIRFLFLFWPIKSKCCDVRMSVWAVQTVTCRPRHFRRQLYPLKSYGLLTDFPGLTSQSKSPWN